MKHPEMVYSHDLKNNCTIIKWGESGYYKTDYPEGKYNDEVIDYMNQKIEVTPEMKRAMEICSMVAQENKNLNWEKHYEMIMNRKRK